MMDEKMKNKNLDDYKVYIQNRITELRIARGITEREMSLGLDKSDAYINKIANGKSGVSLPALADICDYFGITMADFFDGMIKNPMLHQELRDGLLELSDHDIELVRTIINRLKEK